MKKMMARSSMRASSLNGDLLHAVGLEGQLLAERIPSEDLKVLHVLGKVGYGLLYLGQLHDGAGDVEFESSMSESAAALSLQDLDTSLDATRDATQEVLFQPHGLECWVDLEILGREFDRVIQHVLTKTRKLGAPCRRRDKILRDSL